MNLSEFLLARIAEDEMQARKHLLDADRHGWGSYPARVLAECDAKRRIVELADRDDNWRYGMHSEAIGEVLRLLALPYADHPDYREEWRP